MYATRGRNSDVSLSGNPGRRCCAFGTHTCVVSRGVRRASARTSSRQTAARISFGGVSRESPTHVFPARRPTRSHRRRRASRAFLARARILVRIPRELLAKQARRRASRPGGPRARLVARPSAVHAASVLGRGDGVPPRGRRKARRRPRPRRGRHHDPSGHHLPGAPRRRA